MLIHGVAELGADVKMMVLALPVVDSSGCKNEHERDVRCIHSDRW